MDLFDALADLFADNAGLLTAVAVAAALTLVGFILFTLVQGKLHVRRRAADGAGAMPDGRSESARSLDGLLTYVEASLSGGDEREQRVLRMRLMQAGFFDGRAVAWFFAARLCAAVLLGVAGFLFLPMVLGEDQQAKVLLWAAGAAICGYFLPNVVLSRIIAKRVVQHRTGFPDFMDLMVVCAEAGLTMEASIDRIARELVDGYPSLAENLYIASLEIRAGKAFTDALERLGRRLGIDEATMLATLLQQSAELGTSLSQSLRVYSDEMRNKRMSRAEEKAHALPSKLVIPLTLFVFPVLIATLLYPAVIRLMQSFAATA
jgi:tight adherence protein C